MYKRGMVIWIVVVLVVLSTVWASAQSGGEWTIGRWAITGGGGTSSGGEFLVRGSMGQPEAGEALTGGEFTVRGGFWPGEGGVGPTPTPTRPSAVGVSPLKLPYIVYSADGK